MAGPIDADGVDIDNSGYMACGPADDVTHFILTIGVPPECRSDHDEAVLVATGLTTDRSDSPHRAKEYDDSEGEAALSNHDDPVPLPVRVRTRSAFRKCSPALHANADKDQGVKLRRHNDCMLVNAALIANSTYDAKTVAAAVKRSRCYRNQDNV
ncbi:hypothetical protein HPB52_017824 [Rhipicephalus sanguineus]|uniref:Uncharacterized protein n=1 Tax=Rhipicephalus sanguineus TaxID=34632 RepID=A0A9D4QBV3_RHISA|nr:hypothetical protein HPB52_017824 [Rhipicephalus sanguineus]